MHSGSSLTPNNPAFSVAIGIASLVLEGRPLCDDDYDLSDEPVSNNLGTSSSSSGCSSSSSSNENHQKSYEVHHRSNVTTQPDQLQQQQQQQSQQQQSLPQSDTHQPIANNYSQFLPRDQHTEHIYRLRHKLLSLRSAPSTSRGIVGQSIAVTSARSNNEYDSDEDLEEMPNEETEHNPPSNSANLMNSLQSLAETCLKTTPRSYNRTHGLLQTVEAWTPSGYVAENATAANVNSNSTTTQPINITKKCDDNQDGKVKKQMGPHCEEFFKKIGLVKGVNGKTVPATIIGGPVKNSPLAVDLPDVDGHVCLNTSDTVSYILYIFSIK